MFCVRNVKSASFSCSWCRSISTSIPCQGKKNFRKFDVHIFRGTEQFRKEQKENPDPDLPTESKVTGARPVGYTYGKKFVTVPEMIPELVVPDLTDCKLKPYVSYRAPDVVQSEFKAQDLFNAVYSKKIIEDLKNGKLDEYGNPLEPSPDEALSKEEAFNNARKVGNDIF